MKSCLMLSSRSRKFRDQGLASLDFSAVKPMTEYPISLLMARA